MEGTSGTRGEHSRRRLTQAVLRTMRLTENDLGRERTRNMTLHSDQTDGHRPPCHHGNRRRSLTGPQHRQDLSRLCDAPIENVQTVMTPDAAHP